MFIKIDERKDVVVAGNEEESVAFAANHFIECAKSALELHGNFFVALSGGSTPKKIYQKLASDYKKAIDWEKVFLFWSDERAVSETDPESNYKMAMDSGFSKLKINPLHIFRMKGEGDIVAHAEEYESIIKKTLQGRHFDLIMLGVGEDGHTASLFPHTKGLTVTNRLVIANEVPQKKTWRMTFTYTLINSAHNIVFYALGENKQSILKEVLFKEDLPASKVGTLLNKALWVLDKDAAASLH